MGITVGIDLGTTYSAVSTFDKATGTTKMLKNSFNSDTTPSVVCFDNGQVVIGSEAKEMQGAGNENAASFYKSWMGNPNFAPVFDGKAYTSEDLSGFFLRELVKDVESANGVKIDGAVITVPAYFNDAQREATMRAGKKAGLKVLKIINEPTAAIISYGLAGEGERTVMVYDLGGGTFDVTVAKVKDGKVQVLGTDGDHQLGGKDWDMVIKNYLIEQFESEFGICISDYPDADNELQVECESIKKKLTQLPKVIANVSCEGNVGRYTVTREWFDGESTGVLGKTQFLISQCLRDIQMDPGGQGIDEVVLVGGSTRMPQVREMIKNEYHCEPVTSVDVDTVVARGAAIQAAICAERTITLSLGNAPAPASGASAGAAPKRRTLSLSADCIQDVTAHSLGMLSISEDQSKYVNTIILPKNTEVPSEKKRPFQIASRRDGKGEIEVYILQGESLIPGENYILGKYLISEIDPQTERETIVDISYAYNENGMVDVSATQRKTGKKLKVVKMPVPDDMSWIDEAPVIPVTKVRSKIIMAIDRSGSMNGSMGEVERAAFGFLEDMDLTASQIGIVSFADDTRLITGLTDNYKEIAFGIRTVTSHAGGRTYSPLGFILNQFRFDPDDRNYVLVLTDGEWFDPDEATAAASRLKQEGVEIICIGIADANASFLKKIASSDTAALKTDLSQVRSSFSSIAQAITEGRGVSLG